MNRGPFLVVSALVVVAASVTAVNSAFFTGSATVEVTVVENITIDEPVLEILLAPNEELTWFVTIGNSGGADSPVDLHLTVTPSASKVEAEAIESAIVPAHDSIVVSVEIAAANDVTPGLFEIELSVSRSGDD